jgi:hypothetical protein
MHCCGSPSLKGLVFIAVTAALFHLGSFNEWDYESIGPNMAIKSLNRPEAFYVQYAAMMAAYEMWRVRLL